jgi:hypothetical protein
MEETKEEKNKRLSLPAELAKRLLALKGDQSWEEFVATLESKFRPNRISNPMKYYFEFHLKEMHLTEDQVCRLCKKYTMIPQKLEPDADYPSVLYQRFGDLFKKASINLADVREFFALQNLQQTVPVCLRCGAYEGQIPPSDFAWNILNFDKELTKAELAYPVLPFNLEKQSSNKK